MGSLRDNGRLVGLFYADNAANDYVPSEEQLNSFNHLVQNARLCITLMASRNG